jgi:general secretion pathway protein L
MLQDAMNLVTVRSLWSWWVGEISNILPDRVKQAFSRRDRCPEIFLSQSQFAVYAPCAASEEPAVRTPVAETPSIEEAISNVRRTVGRAKIRRGVRLLVDAEDCLCRIVRLPPSAAPRIGQILDLQLDRIVPLPVSEILHDWHEIETDAQEVTRAFEHVILKRALVAPLVDRLSVDAIPVCSIGVRKPDGSMLPVNLLRHGGLPTFGSRSPAGAFARASVGAVVLMSALVVYLGFERQTRALDAISAQVEVARAEAMALQREVKDREDVSRAALSILGRKNETYSTIELWEEITRVLPDGTWLTALAIEDQSLMLTGFAKSAPDLILRLDASPMFREAGFTSPIIRDPASKTERFSIRVRTEDRSLPENEFKQARSR